MKNRRRAQLWGNEATRGGKWHGGKKGCTTSLRSAEDDALWLRSCLATQQTSTFSFPIRVYLLSRQISSLLATLVAPDHSHSLSQARPQLLYMTKYTSPTKKARICRDWAAGLSDGYIAKKFNLHCTTVKCIFDRYTKSEAYYDVKPKPGHSHKFTVHDTRLAARMLAHGEARDVADLQRKLYPDISADTIWTWLWQSGLQAYVCHSVPYLLPTQKKKHYEWAKAHANWILENWHVIIFSGWLSVVLEGSRAGIPWVVHEEGRQTQWWKCHGMGVHHSSGGWPNLLHWG